MQHVYKRNLPHIDNGRQSYFLTFCTRDRWILPPRARSIVLECCRHNHNKKYFLDAVVVMPDHVHLILTPCMDRVKNAAVPISSITRVLKSYSAFRINRELGRTGSLWQDETYDHVIRGGEMAEMYRYVLLNPVRKGLVSAPEEYEWVWWNRERTQVEPLPMRTF